MTVQDLIEALQRFPASAETSTVYLSVEVFDERAMKSITVRRLADRLVYEHGETDIKS